MAYKCTCLCQRHGNQGQHEQFINMLPTSAYQLIFFRPRLFSYKSFIQLMSFLTECLRKKRKHVKGNVEQLEQICIDKQYYFNCCQTSCFTVFLLRLFGNFLPLTKFFFLLSGVLFFCRGSSLCFVSSFSQARSTRQCRWCLCHAYVNQRFSGVQNYELVRLYKATCYWRIS